jgi:hypothetical protein
MEELDSNLCMCVCRGKKENKGVWRGGEGRGYKKSVKQNPYKNKKHGQQYNNKNKQHIKSINN